MRRFISLVILVLLVAPVVAKTETLRLATLDWEPYAGRSLSDGGFTAQIVTEAFKRAGYDVQVEFVQGDTAVEGAKKGTYDGVFPEYHSPERSRDFLYTSFFSGSRLVFYRRSSSAVSYKTLHDLTPYKIGTVRGHIYTEEFDNATYLNKVEADSDEANIRNLAQGGLDLVVIDTLVARHLIRTRVPEAEGTLEAMEPPLIIHELSVILPRRNPASEKRAREFNKAFESMDRDGTVNAIMTRSGLAR
ncbi:MAG TPA: transporter substrate-binding domain-containing protein [Deltaproteobacteria bacterium]|nr:transporter substrate-binding domain-containing protein [Deltaproteobacteria bacterium]OQC23562.1 MAG: extracellular solute-binding protein [Deltaproteobacteria bacterium ADurb.Bin072]HRW79830.1 transporter substrate-binding domain-containing protein [Desulfomonilia bacterium]HNQ84947.1 transporter substrate-binding domain-containing protein [Deltaproteobacteria bacterium]HNS88719.1 transporter substrate-binding domain-containing protein [Deltaproteobacteria bacterium]